MLITNSNAIDVSRLRKLITPTRITCINNNMRLWYGTVGKFTGKKYYRWDTFTEKCNKYCPFATTINYGVDNVENGFQKATKITRNPCYRWRIDGGEASTLDPRVASKKKNNKNKYNNNNLKKKKYHTQVDTSLRKCTQTVGEPYSFVCERAKCARKCVCMHKRDLVCGRWLMTVAEVSKKAKWQFKTFTVKGIIENGQWGQG